MAKAFQFRCGRDTVELTVPGRCVVYESTFPAPPAHASTLVARALQAPIGGAVLEDALAQRRPGPVVVVVSDITRPIPYAAFLGTLLDRIEKAGVARDDIVLLVATGMHRVSTASEHREMFGDLVDHYRIVDHDAANDAELVQLDGATHSGARVKVNRLLHEAGCRIVTGLVEPHFMAGFSGGRKSICPGLVDLDTVRNFHGYAFLASEHARNGNLDANPLHDEALSVASMVGVDFGLNMVLDNDRRVVAAFAGDLTAAHAEACEFVRGCACPDVAETTDIALTSSGGYPLDATFYQCVKGIVSCLSAVKEDGTILAFGGCSEGIGSPEYTTLMSDYANQWRRFLHDIESPTMFVKDQWQFQMHARALSHVGQGNLHFVTDGLPQDDLLQLSVHAHAADDVRAALQNLLDTMCDDDTTVAVFPEGPYCAPVGVERVTSDQ